MKTADQWCKESIKQLGFGTKAEFVSKIQLDAMKEGMRGAAVILQTIGPCSGTRDWNESRWATINHGKDAILNAAEQLTEQDL